MTLVSQQLIWRTDWGVLQALRERIDSTLKRIIWNEIAENTWGGFESPLDLTIRDVNETI